MRLGLIIYGSLETISGGYLYDRQLVRFLREQGDDVKIISLPWRTYVSHLGDNLSPALFKQLRALEVDALIQDELNHPSLAWLNNRLKQITAYPVVTIVHHLRCSEARPAWINSFYRGVEKRYLKSVDALILNSQTTRRSISQLGINLDMTPHILAYPAGDNLRGSISEQEISQRAFQSGPLRLLFLGNLIPRKGLHTLLSALERLPADIFRLTVVGDQEMDPAYSAVIRQQISSSLLEDRVQLAGALEDDKLMDLMSSSHALVVPSSYEGFGIVYLEGMSFGLPAIATSGGAAREIITDKKNGYLISPGDAHMLADRLRELAANRQLLLQFSLAARHRYQSHPTWENTSQSIRSFLQDLCMRVI